MSSLRSEAGKGIREISKGSWAKYANIDFGEGNASAVRIAMDATPTNGPAVELRLDSPEGELIGTLNGEQREVKTVPIKGIHNLFLVFPSIEVRTVDYFEFLSGA